MPPPPPPPPPPSSSSPSSLINPLIVAHFRAIVWYSLDNDLLESALFAAERLHAYDQKSPDSAYLLGLCLLRDSQYQQAEALMKDWLMHVGCAYVYAQCCLKLGGGRENLGINALESCKKSWNQTSSWNQHSDTTRRAIPDAAAIHCLIGKLWQSLGGEERRAVDPYVAAVKCNPFVWEAFTGLCETGANLKVCNIFKQSQEMIDSLKNLSTQDELAARPSNPEGHQHNPFSSTAHLRDRADLSCGNHPSFSNGLNEGAGKSGSTGPPETPTAPSANPGSHDLLGGQNGIGDKPPPPVRKSRTAAAELGARRLVSRATRNHDAELKRPNSSTTEPTAPAAPARRSTRLNTLKFGSRLTGSDRETRLASKEREREREAKKRAVSTRNRSINLMANAALGKERDKERGSSTEDINMSDVPSKPPAMTALLPPPPPPPKPLIDPKREEAQLYLLDLYKTFGTGYFNLARFNCSEALQAFDQLPVNQRETPWALCQIGRIYHEMANYSEGENIFRKVRELDPVRTKDMEIFSTILWHQRKDVDLSYLAHELIERNRHAPEAWCALGNCFSLQRDHDQALRCFERATQINPKFPYAFTLQGHEHVSNEEYEKAEISYRNAITADRRHYNAWYGLGKVYEKMGRYEVAEKHFRSAVKMNPTNPILVCCVGMVLEKMRDYRAALTQYNKASRMDPKSALAKFKKARTLMSLQNYKAALHELLELKDMAPDEANVHFLLGRLYKAIRDKPNAIKHLTIALNLDPKASHLIKEVIENLDDDDDAYLAEDSEVYRFLDGEN